MGTINIADFAGNSTPVELPNANGRTAAAAARSVVLSVEDKAAVDAIAAKLPGVGTAGTAATDVVSVQGIAGGEALAVSLSAIPPLTAGADTIGAVLQAGGAWAVTGPVTDVQLRAAPLPVSGTVAVSGIVAPVAVTGPVTDAQLRAAALPVTGTVTANIGTVAGLALDATLTGGGARVIHRGGAKGTTTAADVTSTAASANRQPLDIVAYDATGNAVVQTAGPVQVGVTLVAATPATVLAANPAALGARILNYTAAPIYLTPGSAGTPASGGGSDFIPAASGGVPGQWEAAYRPVTGLRAVGASAGDLTVISW